MKLFLIIFAGVFILFDILAVACAMCISGRESRKEERR